MVNTFGKYSPNYRFEDFYNLYFKVDESFTTTVRRLWLSDYIAASDVVFASIFLMGLEKPLKCEELEEPYMVDHCCLEIWNKFSEAELEDTDEDLETEVIKNNFNLFYKIDAQVSDRFFDEVDRSVYAYRLMCDYENQGKKLFEVVDAIQQFDYEGDDRIFQNAMIIKTIVELEKSYEGKEIDPCIVDIFTNNRF